MSWKTNLPHWLDFFKHHLILLGFFGKDAIRMLRETWEGRVNVEDDPATGQKTVKPVGADLLAQEIFSMLNDSTPQTNNAPVIINQPGGGQGLVINGQSGSPPSFHVTGGDVNLATTGSIAIGQASSATSSGSNLTLSGSQIAIPPLGVIKLPATDYNPLQPGSLPIITLATSAGPVAGQAYMGEVMGAAGGGNYTMQLAGVSGTVTATPGQVGTGYVVPNGTWSVVVATGLPGTTPTYYFQPFPYAKQTINGPLQAPSTLHNVVLAMQNFGMFVDATSNAPPTISGNLQTPGSGGALYNLMVGLSNLGIVVNNTNDTPQVITGASIMDFTTGGLLWNTAVALSHLGLVGYSAANLTPPSVSGSCASVPALQHLVQALAGLNIIGNNTTP